MKKTLCSLFLLFFCWSAFAQSVFQKIYGQAIYMEGAADIVKTYDGGYMVGGYAYRPQTSGATDFYLLKLNNSGTIQYGKLYGRSGFKDVISSISQTKDSGFIMLTSGQMSTGGNYNSSLVKANKQGLLQWNKYFTNGNSSMNNANVEQTTDGGFIVATSQYISSVSSYYIQLLKMNSNGDTVWTKDYKAAGGTDALTIKQTADNGYILGAMARGAVPIGRPCLLKLDSLGNMEWYKTYALNGLNNLNNLQITADGGYVFVGTKNIYSQDSARIFVVKSDALGNPSWMKVYATTNAMYANKIIETSSGKFLITGYWLDSAHTNADALALKLDNNGTPMWAKRYGGPKVDYGKSVLELPDEGQIIVGTYGTPNGAYPEIYLIQTDSSGYSACNEKTISITASTSTALFDTIAISMTHLPYTISTKTYGTGNALDQTTFCSTLDIPDFYDENEIELLPNPSSDRILFTAKTSQPYQVQIFNAQGNELFHQNITSGQRIETGNWANGIYYLRFSADGRQTSKKLVIVH